MVINLYRIPAPVASAISRLLMRGRGGVVWFWVVLIPG